MLSIGGWSHGTGGFHYAAKNPMVFARNSLIYIQTHGFDGIDLDWEYPGYVDHYSKPGKLEDVARYVPFLKAMKSVYGPAGLMVTAAVGAYPVSTNLFVYFIPRLGTC